MKNKFAERFRDLRETSYMLQEELAKSLKVSKSAISAWELGRNEPGIDMLIDIANLFCVTVDYLTGFSD